LWSGAEFETKLKIMIERLLELLKLVKPRQPHLPQTNFSGSLPITEKPKIEHKPKWGDACKKCGRPAYNDRGKGVCYLCDTGIFD
jgi:hypothetical protein